MSRPHFASAIATQRDGDAFVGEIQPGWDIAGNANGGYLMAMAATAMLEETQRQDPVTVTAHFHSAGTPGPVVVTPHVIKSGRRFATASATVTRGSTPLLSVLGTFGELGEDVASLHVDGQPPDLPPVEDCFPVIATETFPPPFMGQVRLRLHPHDANFLSGVRSGRAAMTGYFALLDDEEITTTALLCALDAFPPTIFNTDLPVAWTPTIELTAHVRSRPAPGWLRCRFTTRFITGGLLEEDGEIWDERGVLVAQSRQLALVPRSTN